MRLVVESQARREPQVVLNQLYKHTQLQDSFGVIMLALVDGVPRTLNLAEMVGYYVDHQIDVVTRRTGSSCASARSATTSSRAC